MKACQLIAHGRPGRFELRDIPLPKVPAGSVLVSVRACGVNHLDLWLEAGELPIPLPLPRTPGSEIAGVIAQVGSDAGSWRVGDRVAIQSNLFCGACEFCERGDESLCLRGQLLGIECDGGFAEAVLVPVRVLVPLPEAVTFVSSAALTLAGSTAMHMLTNRSQVRPGDWVLVMGAASGVGSAAIQIALGLGARVITTGSTPQKRELGLRLGALAALDSTSKTWPGEVRRLTGKRGADLVVEHIGGPVLAQVFGCLARGGTVVTCGATAGKEVAFDLWPFFVKQQRLIGSYGRNRADMKLTLDWAANGKLKPVIDSVYSLADTPEALRRLRERQVLGKLVVEVSTA